MSTEPTPTAIVLLSCPDQRGLVAAVAELVFRHGGNIVHAEQHTDVDEQIFFQRVEFELDDFDVPRTEIAALFAPLIERYGMEFHLSFSDEVPRVALLMSKEVHCTYDLLARWRSGELAADIPLIVSNHPDHAELAAHFDVGYHVLTVTPETRDAQEQALLELLAVHHIDLIILARYMQILGPAVVARHPNAIVNIHHSFLPAFVGARPYHQAYQRGVKVVGVTAHYVTDELDQGPIIDQDVVRVSHRDTVDDLVRRGRDLEKVVLARAVRAHLEHRVLVYGNKTVVFA